MQGPRLSKSGTGEFPVLMEAIAGVNTPPQAVEPIRTAEPPSPDFSTREASTLTGQRSCTVPATPAGPPSSHPWMFPGHSPKTLEPPVSSMSRKPPKLLGWDSQRRDFGGYQRAVCPLCTAKVPTVRSAPTAHSTPAILGPAHPVSSQLAYRRRRERDDGVHSIGSRPGISLPWALAHWAGVNQAIDIAGAKASQALLISGGRLSSSGHRRALDWSWPRVPQLAWALPVLSTLPLACCGFPRFRRACLLVCTCWWQTPRSAVRACWCRVHFLLPALRCSSRTG